MEFEKQKFSRFQLLQRRLVWNSVSPQRYRIRPHTHTHAHITTYRIKRLRLHKVTYWKLLCSRTDIDVFIHFVNIVYGYSVRRMYAQQPDTIWIYLKKKKIIFSGNRSLSSSAECARTHKMRFQYRRLVVSIQPIEIAAVGSTKWK